MKNAVFWDMAPCRYFVNRRFGGTYHPHFQGMRNPRAMNQRELQPPAYAGSLLADFLYPEDGGDAFPETSVYKISTRRHTPEDDILHTSPLF
jgi:hypothetical protein